MLPALSTPESIVIDGANGVTREAREHFPSAGLSLGLAVAALLIAAVVVRRGPRWLVVVALGLGALPGLAHVLALRADAPLGRGAVASTVAGTLADLQARAPWPRVTLVREDDDVMFPLTRYAVPGRAPVDGGVELETRGAKLGEPCRVEGARVICGVGP